MAAAVEPLIVYPLKLSSNGTVTFNARRMEKYLIQQFNCNRTAASALVDEITSLKKEKIQEVRIMDSRSMEKSSTSGECYATISRSQ